MSKKLKGFSLAELLISLLIISIVLSAAIPTITRKAGADREQIWRWTLEGNNAYFGTGSNQTAIIGAESVPKANEDIAALLIDTKATDSSTERAKTGDINLADVKYSPFGDKLSILKKTIQSSNSNFMNSHISFYTMANNEAATTNDIAYAGRLAMDTGNVALGMGTLQSIAENNVGENTAIGHFALLRDKGGFRNTAIGKKALSFNESGSYNTAVGFASLFQLGRTESSATDAFYENTAIGALSQLEKATGINNTSIGSQSLRKNATGNNNTVIGQSALISLAEGSGNTIIGTSACKNIVKGDDNICIGYLAGNSAVDETSSAASKPILTEDKNGLYIGAGTESPLISGHTKKIERNSKTLDKEVIINARQVLFRTFDGARPLISFETNSGSDGYGANLSTSGYSSIVNFDLRDAGSAGNGSVRFALRSLGNSTTKEAKILAYDKYDNTMANINYNETLKFDFSKLGSESKISFIGENATSTTSKYTLSFNNKLEVENNNNAPLVTISESNGFKVQNTSTKYFNISKNNEMNIVDSDKKVYISAADGISLMNGSTSGLYLSAQNGLSLMNGTTKSAGLDSNGITLGNSSDIKLPKLHTTSKYVSGAIKELDDKIKNLAESGTISSDEKLKNIIGDNIAGLKEINQIEVKNYTYKADEKKTPHVGVIAQQLQKIFPNSVTKDEDGYLRIRTEEIFYAMVNSIKELYVQVQNLTAKITGLDKRITELEKQNKMLIEQNKAFEKRLKKLEQKTK